MVNYITNNSKVGPVYISGFIGSDNDNKILKEAFGGIIIQICFSN